MFLNYILTAEFQGSSYYPPLRARILAEKCLIPEKKHWRLFKIRVLIYAGKPIAIFNVIEVFSCS